MKTYREIQQEKYNELALYTLQHPDPFFIHQYAVDAFAAQNASESTKPITLAFALVGLYLHLEKNYTGREVQLAHMDMAKNKKTWPKFGLPEKRGNIRVADVLETPPGEKRDEIIKKWSASVWEAYRQSQVEVIELARATLRVIH